MVFRDDKNKGSKCEWPWNYSKTIVKTASQNYISTLLNTNTAHLVTLTVFQGCWVAL